MTRLKDENYYVIHAWMINRLGLSGNELTAFAIMYGFCQDGEHEFKGSLNYIADWMGVKTRNTVIKAIDALIDKGIITKEVKIDASGSYITNSYKINYMTVDDAKNAPLGEPKRGSVENTQPSVENTQPSVKITQPPSVENTQGVVQNLHNPSVKITQHNKDIYKDIYKDSNKDIYISDSQKGTAPFKKIVGMYHDICKSLPRVKIITHQRKKAIKNIWLEFQGEESSFLQLFSMAEESDFLTGRDGKWSTGASFDWLMNKNNAIKVLEGNYENKGKRAKGKNNVIAAQEELARRLGENDGDNEPTYDDTVWGVW